MVAIARVATAPRTCRLYADVQRILAPTNIIPQTTSAATFDVCSRRTAVAAARAKSIESQRASLVRAAAAEPAVAVLAQHLTPPPSVSRSVSPYASTANSGSIPRRAPTARIASARVAHRRAADTLDRRTVVWCRKTNQRHEHPVVAWAMVHAVRAQPGIPRRRPRGYQ